MRVVVGAEYREAHGQGDGGDHDVRSSESKNQPNTLNVKAVRARQVRRWISMVRPSATGFGVGLELILR
ncbi:hypothetical protein D3C80_1788130 [compost metagenome]